MTFRLRHADFTYEAKYGSRDYRGGGRSSARETATLAAAGAIARKILPEVNVRGALVQMGPHRIDRAKMGLGRDLPQSVLLPGRATSAAFFEEYLDGIRKSGSSIGADRGRRRRRAGRPRRADLCQADAEPGAAMMSINAVKGVEIGVGFGAAELSGEEMPTRCAPAITATRFPLQSTLAAF